MLFTTHSAGKELMSLIDKEHSQINMKKHHNLIEIWAKDSRELPEKDSKIAIKYMKRYWSAFTIGEMGFKYIMFTCHIGKHQKVW